MNKQIQRRIKIEAEKKFPFDVKEELYGHTRHVGRYDEHEAFLKGAGAMFKILLDKSCEWWENQGKWTESYRKAMEAE